MRKTILSAMVLAALAAPALAAALYPVSGKWGQSTSAEPGPIDCAKLRVIEFKGDQRTDSKGGVPAYRIRSVTAEGRRAIALSTSSPPARSATAMSATR